MRVNRFMDEEIQAGKPKVIPTDPEPWCDGRNDKRFRQSEDPLIEVECAHCSDIDWLALEANQYVCARCGSEPW